MKTKKSFALRAVVLGFLLLSLSTNSPKRPARLATPAPVVIRDEFESDELRQKRDDWLVFQRQYPFTAIPGGARRNAWLSLPQSDFITQAAGDTWLEIGPRPITSAPLDNWGLTNGRVNAVAVSPVDPMLILVGGADGGVWRSTDGGSSFAPVTDNQVDLSVGSIAFSKSNPSVAYVGMGSVFLGTGVLRSMDSGATWSPVSNASLPSPGLIRKIAVDPSDPNRVYVAQYALKGSSGSLFSSGFYLSTNGGVSWRKTLTGLPEDVAVDPINPQRLYLALSRVDEPGSPPAGLYRSTNSGETWSHSYVGPFDPTRFPNIRVTVANNSTAYVFGRGSVSGATQIRVAASTDGGTSWNERGTNGLNTSIWDYIAVDPTNPNVLYIGLEDVFKSTDGGVNWVNKTNNYALVGGSLRFQPSQSNSHTDQHGLAFSPSDPNTIYIATDGGLYRSTNGGNAFQALNTSLSLGQLYSIALHPTDRGISYCGTQDNGSVRRLREPSQWKEIITGDGGSVVIDPVDNTRVFSTYIFGTIFRWRDNASAFDVTVGTNTIFGEPESNPRIGFIAAFAGNRVDSTLYFGTWRLFTSKDRGATWQATAGATDLTKGVTASGPDVLTTIAVARSNTNVIYTGSAQGAAMVSTDAGATWKNITAGLPLRFISSISVDAQNSAVAYLTVSGYASSHVFKTTNAGTSWTDINGNLPDIPTNALLIDPLDANTLFAGTDIGVFRSRSAGFNWEYFSSGMPPVVVHAFDAQSNGLIQAGTFGRGVYELVREGVTFPAPVIDSASIEGKKVAINGSKFGSTPRVLINGEDRSDFVTSVSDTLIRLKGKPKKLGVKSGENTIQVFDSTGAGSNIFKVVV